jgi:hypothetical protein
VLAAKNSVSNVGRTYLSSGVISKQNRLSMESAIRLVHVLSLKLSVDNILPVV